ncbi:cell division FtsA domain-containing protein [Ammoniphilus oxalaticus]|uniref:cell division FtsA domain-containing protein n=1 Tax=Ammoniphilus oxalaticus TaxID=66863 RepID=UPI000E728AF1|nr:cell division FtsA domain-containing protein [Ammoniphilus oxalaticus]
MTHNHSDFIFSLDIGTRAIVGMILQQTGDSLTIVDYESIEHRERSMLDGQIHHVSEVAESIACVRDRLVERNNPLKYVSVAAAGRTLITTTASFEHAIAGYPLLNQNDTLSLELSAIQEAQKQIADKHSDSGFRDYYCVGYSVINYYLDGEIIGNLIDQRGQSAKVEIIATFLPRLVVDSLMTALQKADLQMKTLTLEPIAAINALVPASMRKLNIALIDIGAGTSDIAITADGTIVAYGMVAVAGDEITEALSQAYLLDFNEAEQLKRVLAVQSEVRYTDILGMEHVAFAAEIIEQLNEVIEQLAEQITHKILELNEQAPQAVMLIGGGSLTPTLPESIAKKLQLPTSRVAVRGADAIKGLKVDEQLKGPEFVTPIGIAVAAQRHPIKYVTVRLNDEEVRIFDLKKITVGDVLLHAGWDLRTVKPRPGLALSVVINGDVKFIPGKLGKPPLILINGQVGRLNSIVYDQDNLRIEAGADGQAPQVIVKDLIAEFGAMTIHLDDEVYPLQPMVLKNGKRCQPTDQVNDRDAFDIRWPQTVADVLKQTGYGDQVRSINCELKINGQTKRVKEHDTGWRLNDEPASPQQSIREGDHLTFVQETGSKQPTVRTLITPEIAHLAQISVTFNGQPLSIPLHRVTVLLNGISADWDQPLQNGDIVELEIAKHPTRPVYHDVFAYTIADITKPDGAIHMKTLVNGKAADFQTALHDGDEIELRWDIKRDETI